MKDTRYAFCVAKIRALENKMLTKQDISSLINSQDLTSAFVFLKESGYAKDGETVASLIKRQGDELDKLLFEIVPDTKELENLYGRIHAFFIGSQRAPGIALMVSL